MDARRGEKRIALFADNGHARVERAHPIFAGIGAVVPETRSDVVRLIHSLGTQRTRIYLNQTDQVRVEVLEEGGNAIQNRRVAA